jgi:ABC-type multidrug transport system fused ATPase/permease subunit
MKLAFIPFLTHCLFKNFHKIINEKWVVWYLALVLIVFVISVFTPFIIGGGVNFYFFTDILGFGLTVVSLPILYAAFKYKTITILFIEKISAKYLTIISFYIIFYYVISGGMKISITPEMQIPMAIIFGAYFFGLNKSYRPSLWIFSLVLVACILSQLRENVIVYLLLLVICLTRKWIWVRWTLAGLGLFTLVLSAVFYSSMTKEVISIVFGFENIQDILSPSVLQRFVEIDLVFAEMAKVPLSFFWGQGFGATYENINNQLEFYGDRVHNIHSTPTMLYLRNGPYGVFLFFSVFVFACIKIFSRNDYQFRVALIVVVFCLTLFFNQYLYWNIHFGLILAMWWFGKYIERPID